MRREIKRFKLRDPQSPYYFWVCVYKSLKDLRASADSHSKRVGNYTRGENDEALGVTQTFVRINIMDIIPKRLLFLYKHLSWAPWLPFIKYKRSVDPHIGFIRLHHKMMSNELIAHELVHAAFGQLNAEIDAGKRIPDPDDQEPLAYIYGRLARKMTRQLYKHGYWD